MSRELHDRILNDAWAQMMRVCPPEDHPEQPKNNTRLLDVLLTAKRLGIVLLPHQISMVASVTELLDDDDPDGRLRYGESLILMARQSGKSATLLSLTAERLLTQQGYRGLWASQRIESAIQQIEQDTWPRLRDTKIAEKYGIRFKRANGPSLNCSSVNSRITLGSTGAVAGMRGQHFDGLVLDELFSIIGNEAEGSLYPTLSTRYKFGASALLASSAPLESSDYLVMKMGKHEKSANGSDSNLCYWRWAASEKEDPGDPAVWHRVIPGLTFGLIDEKTIQQTYESMPLDVFKREYLTIPTPSGAMQMFVPVHVWEAVELPHTSNMRTTPPIWLGIDADPDQTRATIVAADATGVIELVAQRPGVAWVAEFVEQLWYNNQAASRIAGVALMSPGPMAGTYDRLRVYGEGHRLRQPKTGKLVSPVFGLKMTDLAVASQNLLEAVTTQEIAVVHSGGVFVDAVEQSRRRPYGTSGAFTIARKDFNTEASALVAAAIALHVAKGRGWEEADAAQDSANMVDAMRAWRGEEENWFMRGDD